MRDSGLPTESYENINTRKWYFEEKNKVLKKILEKHGRERVAETINHLTGKYDINVANLFALTLAERILKFKPKGC